MERRLFLALFGAALIAPYARANSVATWSQNFSDYVSSQLIATHTPGIGVAMVKGGHTRFAAGYGYADLETRRRVTPSTILGGSTVALHPGGDPGAVALAAIDTKRGTAALCFSNITPNHGKLPFEKEVIDRLLRKANA